MWMYPGSWGPETTVLGTGVFGHENPQVADAMPPQARIQARARDIRIQELPNHGKQIIQRHQQGLAHGHRDSLLRRGQCCLQPVRRVAAVIHAVAFALFPHRLLRDPVALRRHPRGFVARLDRSPDLRRRRRLFMKRNQHGRTPSRTHFAMKRADRRGSL